VQTVTGAEESSNPVGDSSSAADETSSPRPARDSTGAPVNAPPEVELFADPPQLNEAGASEIKLTASADVVVARLSLNGEQIFEGPPAKFPFVYEALSAKFNFPHHFEIEVEDAEGLKDTATTDLVVQLPQPGAEKCLFKDAGRSPAGSVALAYTRKAIYAVGSRDSGAGLKLTVWALDPDHCEVVLPGWPKTIADLDRRTRSRRAHVGRGGRRGRRDRQPGDRREPDRQRRDAALRRPADLRRGAAVGEDRLGRRASSPGSPRSPASTAIAWSASAGDAPTRTRCAPTRGLDLPADGR
jgi:hypothetical protein